MTALLAFDTATDACSVALTVQGRVFARHQIVPRGHAQHLLPMVQALIIEAQIDLSALQAIAFGCGPGSFMGVRLAMGLAQGLAFGLKIPVISISTLQIIAQTAYQKTQRTSVLAGWDARMHGIYWGLYHCDRRGVMQSAQADQLSAPAAIQIQVNECVLGAGNAWHVYANELSDSLTCRIDAQHTECYPDATAMLPIALMRFQNNEMVAPENAQPVYLRDKVTQ